MERTLYTIGLSALLTVACADADQDLGVGRAGHAVTMDSVAQVFCAVEEANHGRGFNGRWLTWKLGNYSSSSAGEQPVCSYGWCGPEIIQPDCNSTVDGAEDDVYYFGGCNSSTWGEQFAASMWHDGVRKHESYAATASYCEGCTGTTTFGWHPYWVVDYNGECRTLQGWSYEVHCGGSASFSVSGSEPDASICELEGLLIDEILSGAAESEIHSTVTVPAGATSPPTLSLVPRSGYSGDPDLYVKFGSQPTTSSYDCAPYLGGGYSEHCRLENGPGTYYVMVRGYSNYASYGLVGFDGFVPDSVGPECGNGACEAGEDCASCAADCGACGGGGSCEVMTYSASGTSSASYTDSDTVKFTVTLQAGVAYTISTCGSTTTDTYLRLHRNGNQVDDDDDGCGSTYQSSIAYTPSVTGEYVISAGCYGSKTCDGTVAVSPEPTCDGDPGPVCGDGSCDVGEDCQSCASDCGACSGPNPDSCVETDSCGGQAPGGCYCDSMCASFGDCCFDGPC